MWQAISNPGTRWAAVGPTWQDTKGVMFEGESGILAVARRYGLPIGQPAYNRSTATLTLPNGSIIQGFSADRPDRLRGPQFHGCWCDEWAAWRYLDAWDNLRLGLRLGEQPRAVITTTPRPTAAVRALIGEQGTVITRGSTFDNAANLSATALADLRDRYEGTRLGRQELSGEVLDDVEGALWHPGMIDAGRVRDVPDLDRIVVAVDPAVTAGPDSDETGIVVAGRSAGNPTRFYVLADVSGRYTPDGWAQIVADTADEYDADEIVAEANQGHDLVVGVLRRAAPRMRVRKVNASRGKRTRAEPVVALYEQGRVHHVGGFPIMEDQMCAWIPGAASPDRMDALVWAITDLSGRAPIGRPRVLRT